MAYQRIVVEPIHDIDDQVMRVRTDRRLTEAKEKLKAAGRPETDLQSAVDNPEDDILSLDDLLEDLTIVQALDVLLLNFVGRKQAQEFTMTDSIQAAELRRLLREHRAKDVGEQKVLVIDSRDVYDYWKDIIERGAPRVFGLNAVCIKNAFGKLA